MFRCAVQSIRRFDTRETCNETVEDVLMGWECLQLPMQRDEKVIHDLRTNMLKGFAVNVGWVGSACYCYP